MCYSNCGCNSLFGGGDCTWIIILVVLFLVCGCGGNNGCYNNCGCDNNCGRGCGCENNCGC